MKFSIRIIPLLVGGCMAAGLAQAAPVSLDGMGLINQWTDVEGQRDDMPDFIWGTSDVALANRIGLHARFANGLEGTITYSGVAGRWNTANFAGMAADNATGFFTAAVGLHFLFNTAATNVYPQALPIAWQGFVMPFSGNFDLDYNDQNFGTSLSDFRANVGGWGSVEIATYSSAVDPGRVPEPASLGLFGIGLAGLGALARRRKPSQAAT